MTIEADKSNLLAYVPIDGSSIGNGRLRSTLGWDEDRFYAARNALIDIGEIERWKGRGGSVRRVQVDDEDDSVVIGAPPLVARLAEDELYVPMRKALEVGWAKDRRFSQAVVEITAKQGRRATGGRWTRPDIVAVALSTFRFLPDRQFDLVTFEVKPADAIDVTAVYEAVAHLRAATMAYVLVHTAPDQDLDELAYEAQRHGVGLLTAETPDDYASWNELVEPVRQEPDAHRLDEFIATQLSENTRNRLIKDFR